MAAGKGGGGGGKKKKVAKFRADTLLVQRGLAAHANEALALILKRLVVADDGKILVDKSSTMLPEDVALRVKGKTKASSDGSSGAATPTAAADAQGFILGAEVCGTVVAHHGSRVLVTPTETLEVIAEEDRVRYSCSLTPT